MKRTIIAAFLTRDQEFQLFQATDAEAAAKRHRLGIKVLFAGNNAIDQIQQLLPYIQAPKDKRPAAIVIETVVGEGLERLARQAVEAGIGWVLINRRLPYLHELREEYSKIAISSVSTDHHEVGHVQGQQIRALLPQGGTVLYIQGPADTMPAQERLKGTRETLAGSSIELRVYTGQWTEESGYKAAVNWLRPREDESNRPNAVAAQNDAMAIGACNAFEELRPGWGRIPFLGCDGLPESGQRLVRLKRLTATVVTPSNSGRAIEMISSWLQYGSLPPPQVLLPCRSFPDLEELPHPEAEVA